MIDRVVGNTSIKLIRTIILYKCRVIHIISFLKDASHPIPSKQKNNLQGVMLLLGFLCAIILQKHRIDWLFKKSPSQAAFKHLERGRGGGGNGLLSSRVADGCLLEASRWSRGLTFHEASRIIYPLYIWVYDFQFSGGKPPLASFPK